MKKPTSIGILFISVICIVAGFKYYNSKALPHLGETLTQHEQRYKQKRYDDFKVTVTRDFVVGVVNSDKEDVVSLVYLHKEYAQSLLENEMDPKGDSFSGDDVERILKANSNGFEWTADPLNPARWNRADGLAFASYDKFDGFMVTTDPDLLY